jgi:hypothetical protein
MADYIEREAVVMGILGLTIVDPMVAQYADAVLHQIQQAPAADVAPVVRCKDCVHCEEERTVMGYVPFCLKWIMNTTEDGYCHEGVAISGAKMDGDT